jgi:translation initiation factor 2 alpha subunit (eIF-2alpha)
LARQFADDIQQLNDSNGKFFVELALSIREFMNEMMTYLAEMNIKDPKLKVMGIILAGDASTEGLEDIKRVIEKGLPEYKDRFLFSIDPHVIGAIGAAHRARQYVTEYSIMNPQEPPLHEEL